MRLQAFHDLADIQEVVPKSVEAVRVPARISARLRMLERTVEPHPGLCIIAARPEQTKVEEALPFRFIIPRVMRQVQRAFLIVARLREFANQGGRTPPPEIYVRSGARRLPLRRIQRARVLVDRGI